MGTGKTEAVKALGDQLGRFVLVFNCDEAFDFQAMGRFLLDCVTCTTQSDQLDATISWQCLLESMMRLKKSHKCMVSRSHHSSKK